MIQEGFQIGEKIDYDFFKIILFDHKSFVI